MVRLTDLHIGHIQSQLAKTGSVARDESSSTLMRLLDLGSERFVALEAIEQDQYNKIEENIHSII